MNSGYGTTAYFNSESDARRAAEDLRAQGIDVDVRTHGSHGQGFLDTIKNFFTGNDTNTTTSSDYSSSAIVEINGGDPQSIRAIVQQYNGTIGGTGTTGYDNADITGQTGTGTPSGVFGTTGTSSSVTGTTASESGGLVTGNEEYTRTPSGGISGTGNAGMSSSTGDIPNLD